MGPNLPKKRRVWLTTDLQRIVSGIGTGLEHMEGPNLGLQIKQA